MGMFLRKEDNKQNNIFENTDQKVITDCIPEDAEGNVFPPVCQSVHGGGGQGWGATT